MLKKLAPVAVLGLAMSISATLVPANAANDTFKVNVTLIPTCSVTTAAADITLTYTATSGTAGAAPDATTDFKTTCTTNLPYSLSLNGSGEGSASGTPTGVYSYTDSTTQLAYTVEVKTTSTSGTTQSSAAVQYGGGTVDTTFYVLAKMASNQSSARCSATAAGAVSAANSCASTDNTHTITLTY